MKAVFTGGGTGGHIYPALAVAQKFLEDAKWEISYTGSENGMEKKIIEEAGINFTGIYIDGFRSKNPIKNLIVLLKVKNAVKVVKKILKKISLILYLLQGVMFQLLLFWRQKNLIFQYFFMSKILFPVLLTKLAAGFQILYLPLSQAAKNISRKKLKQYAPAFQ